MRPNDKFNFFNTRNYYRIIEKVSHSYRLELLNSWKGLNLFYADYLRKYNNDPLPE